MEYFSKVKVYSHFFYKSLSQRSVSERHMTCVHFLSFTGVTGHHSSSVKFFPLTLVFFYSTVLKSSFSKQDHDNSDVFTTIVFQNEVSSFPHTPSVDVVHCDHINTHLVRGFSQGAAMWWWPWVRTWLVMTLTWDFSLSNPRSLMRKSEETCTTRSRWTAQLTRLIDRCVYWHSNI